VLASEEEEEEEEEEMKPALLAIVIALAGCQTYQLGDEWSPLSQVVERPALPFASDTATTTVGSHVYTTDLKQWLLDYPPGSVEFVALMQHEREHARRQFRYRGMAGELAKGAWIARYLSDHSFMWQEEQAGFYLAIRHLAKNGRWNSQRTLSVANAMSKAYRALDGHRMVSFADAQAWINDVLSGRWKPE
jgi:hypothetical protein